MSELEGTPLEENPPDTEMTGAEATAEGAAEASRGDAPDVYELPDEPRRVAAGGPAGDEKVLTAHQALLQRSPYFKDACATFDDDTPRHIDLADENLDGIGSFLEYLYTGDYFPKRLSGRNLETDPSLPTVDDDGGQLLRHARVCTLAAKFGLPELKTLASSKIHCVNSTAKGEIAYARYVYGHTTAKDRGVRAPVAQFWATRSHVLRSEAEEEFRGLCLEFPQFGYDVLRGLSLSLWRLARRACAPGGELVEGIVEHRAPRANKGQRACSTRSSSATTARRCSRTRAAAARGRGRASCRGCWGPAMSVSAEALGGGVLEAVFAWAACIYYGSLRDFPGPAYLLWVGLGGKRARRRNQLRGGGTRAGGACGLSLPGARLASFSFAPLRVQQIGR